MVILDAVFFAACTEAGSGEPAKRAKSFGSTNQGAASGSGSSGSCFKCGQEGHWSSGMFICSTAIRGPRHIFMLSLQHVQTLAAVRRHLHVPRLREAPSGVGAVREPGGGVLLGGNEVGRRRRVRLVRRTIRSCSCLGYFRSVRIAGTYDAPLIIALVGFRLHGSFAAHSTRSISVGRHCSTVDILNSMHHFVHPRLHYKQLVPF